MDRLLAFENAGEEPPMIFFGAGGNGPADLLDEPMALSLADKAKLGIDLEPCQDFNCDLQWELRMALERIHSSEGHVVPIGGCTPTANKPFDGMDMVSSAMLMELATTVMPEQPAIMAHDSKYTPTQRKAAITRWMEKRARRHLISKTKYRKMKDVAVSKARCRGGKFIKKSERERLALLEKENLEKENLEKENASTLAYPVPTTATPLVLESKTPWNGDTPDWQNAYNFYARSEE